MTDPKAGRTNARRLGCQAQAAYDHAREAIEDNLVPAPDPDEYWCDPCGNWHLHEDQ